LLGFLILFCFKLWLKVNIQPFHCLTFAIAWKWPLKFTMILNSLRNYLDIFANWTVDGEQYAFHENSL
jgi:hypothetical protein